MRRRSARGTLSVWAAVAGLWLVVIVAWATQFGLGRWVAHIQQQDAVATFYSNREPRLGMLVELPLEDIEGRPIVRENSTIEDVLLVIAGSCSECSKKKFDPDKLDLDNFSQVIFIFTSGVDQIRKVRIDFPRHARVVSDPRGQLSLKLNAYYQPRFYLLDRGLRLRKLQGDIRSESNWYIDLLTKDLETDE